MCSSAALTVDRQFGTVYTVGYSRRTRLARLQAGLCTCCGKKPVAVKKGGLLGTRCEYCRSVNVRGTAKKRQEAFDKNVCVRCGASPLVTTYLCSTCQKASCEYRRQLRLAAFKVYGEYCLCCGETNDIFLCIDHVNNDGAVHRRTDLRCGKTIYIWLRRNNYPAGFQTLCYNCNMAKAKVGICPHQSQKS